MTEYWKSAPNYWCKFCKVFVRDSKYERQRHEATGKHKGSVQRSIRDIQRNCDREEANKRRAKDEVARLENVVSRVPQNLSTAANSRKPAEDASLRPMPARALTQAEQKHQVAKLAELGVAVPDEFRKEFAIAGDWTVVSEKPVFASANAGDHESGERQPGLKPRKRDHESNNEAEDHNYSTGAARWGSAYKSYPGSHQELVEVEALLGTIPSQVESPESVKNEPNDNETEPLQLKPETKDRDLLPPVDSEAGLPLMDRGTDASLNRPLFKKRRFKDSKVTTISTALDN